MKNGAPRRAVTLDDDAELMTRDEAQRAAPDLLITNYSMLNIMLRRSIEGPIFEATRQWLKEALAYRYYIGTSEGQRTTVMDCLRPPEGGPIR